MSIKMHIAVISGGRGSERDVSLRSGKAVFDALKDIGYTTSRYDFPHDREKFLDNHKHIDGVMLMVHGAGGEDGEIVRLLESLNIPVQCTGSSILSLTIDKWLTKEVWRSAGVPVPMDRLVDLTEENPVYEGVCVIKALDQGSSIGVVICKNKEAFDKAIKQMKHYKKCLIEEYIEGIEITVPMIEDPHTKKLIIMPIVEIVPPAGGEFDYENKYNGATHEICPARLSKELVDRIHEVATLAYHSLGMTKYGRLDIILRNNEPLCLEINTIPGFTEASLFPKSAEVYGMSFPQLVSHLVEIMKKS